MSNETVAIIAIAWMVTFSITASAWDARKSRRLRKATP